MSFYESERALSEYLLFHYGTRNQVAPWDFIPADSLDFPVRCVRDCLDTARLRAGARALDLGCAVGRSAFELSRHCDEVIGLDFSERFIAAARQMQSAGELPYSIAEEGDLTVPAVARLPGGVFPERVHFEAGDATSLPPGLGSFDVVLMANLIDRLAEPERCLARLPALLNPGGQLIIVSPYTWLESYTARGHWLGGFARDGKRIKTLETLQQILEPAFIAAGTKDLAFLIREHVRKFQWSVAEASLWIRGE